MGLISMIRARGRLKRSQNTRIQKAGIRMQITHKRSTGQKVRLYTNKVGEVYSVERKANDLNEIKSGAKPTSWSVIVKPVSNTELGLTGRIIGNHEVKCLHIVEANVGAGNLGKGRELFRALIDECKQIGVKMFPRVSYSIYVQPAGNKLSKYYQDLGFKPVPFDGRMLQIKIKQ